MEFKLNTEFIELDNLLKVLEFAQSGPEAKSFILAQKVKVNGSTEQRVRCKLRQGDKVEFEGRIVDIVK